MLVRSAAAARPALLALILGALLAAGPAAAPAAAQAPAASGTQEREAELERIRGEIAQLTAEVERTKLRARGLEGDLERVGLELALQERRLAEAASAHALAESRVVESEAGIRELEARLDAERERLAARLTGLYRLGRHGPLRLLLALEPGDHLLAAMRLLRYLVGRDAETVGRFEDLRARLSLERDELATRRRGGGGLAGAAESPARRAGAAGATEDRPAGGRPPPGRGARRSGARARRPRPQAVELPRLPLRPQHRRARRAADPGLQGVLDWPARRAA